MTVGAQRETRREQWWRMPARLAFLMFLALSLVTGARADDAGLEAFARHMGIEQTKAFAAAVDHVRRDGHLPDSFITKRAAERLGWQPGSDLCASAPGRSIGGDRFGNRERRLPERPGRRWYEADLDFSCGRRGAKRLLYSSDRRVYVTVDHYDSFTEVPQ
jgi:hypothetical protein